MLRLLGLAAAWLWLAGSPAAGAAPTAAERRAFSTAQVLFADGAYELAERELGDFAKRHPESQHLPEAVLLQAQARYHLKNPGGAVELLQANLAQAGGLADEYRFWMAEAHYKGGQYAAAAAAYAQLLKDFPRSRRRLEATYGEAFCRYKLQEWGRVKELLGDPAGDFQQLTKARPNDELAARGYLLLGETLLEQKEYRAGEAALGRLNPDQLAPPMAWQRQNLLCRMQLADQRLPEALTNSFKLMVYARASKQKPLLADAVALQAGIYEKLKRYDEAVRIYETNLTEIASPEQRRQALLKVIELTLAQNQTALAGQKLEAFATNQPNDPAQDLVQLTLGELKFKNYVGQAENGATNGLVATNLLPAALDHFNRVVNDHPLSPLVGQAYLQRGWCHWLQGNFEASQPSFRQAAERLPRSPDQAIAQFKLGDTYIWQKDYTNALAQFSMVISNYAAVPAVKEALLDQALYQMLRASIALGDLERASDAFQKIITWYPDSYYSDRSMLVLGQALNQARQPGQARAVFAEMLQKFPASPLAPEARLAMARTFVQENRWAEALGQYNAWAANEAARRQLPAAEFDRAWVHDRAGRATNALDIFTRFVADFPTNQLAPRAQYWIANHHFRHHDLTNAEVNFQHPALIKSTNWPHNPLPFQARLMAGRVALARQSMRDATNYFTSIINDQDCPTNILLAAYFAYGDTMIDLPVVETDNPFKKFSLAIALFEKIPQADPASPLVPAAWGRMGDCYLQLAVRDPAYYEDAASHYLKAMSNTVDVAVRSLARIGLGLVREKQAALTPAQKEILLAEAYDHYLIVLYGRNLRDEETASPPQIKEAALRAIKLKETQQDYPAVIALYRRLKSCLPPLARFCDERIQSIQNLMDGQPTPQ